MTRSDPAPYCPVHPLRRSGPGPLPRALPRRPGREATSTKSGNGRGTDDRPRRSACRLRWGRWRACCCCAPDAPTWPIGRRGGLTELARRGGTPAARRGVGSDSTSSRDRSSTPQSAPSRPPLTTPSRRHRADAADAEAALRLVRDVTDLRAVLVKTGEIAEVAVVAQSRPD